VDDRAARLARIPGVDAVMPVYSRHLAVSVRGGRADVYGLGVTRPKGMALPRSAILYFPAAGHVVIDRVLADKAGVGVGGRLDILGRRLVVDHVTSGGNSIVQFAFLNPIDARALLGEQGRVSYYLLATSRTADLGAVERAAVAAVPGSEVHTSSDFAGAFGRLVSSGFLSVVGVLVGIGFVVGGAVIALTTYTATVEKARDFGVLKAVGAPDGFVYRIVIQQSLLVGLAGSVLGILVAAIAAGLITRWVPEFVTDLRALDVLGVFGIAVLMSIAASFVPVRRINRIDPAMVFRA
jgi:putative ABC transport system permease protein